MADLDLTAAIEAATDAVCDLIGGANISTSESTIAAEAVRAAAPLIEAAVRGQAPRECADGHCECDCHG